jgi:hypothetical protein
MALIVQDRVKVNTTTTGTGTIVLANTAPTGYQSFAVIGDANTTYYTIASQTDNEWEVGIGTYFLANSSLSRTTILSSSAANAAVTFSAGTKDVFVTYPANRAVYEDETGNVAGYPITGGTINGTVIGGSNAAAGTFTTLEATGNTDLGTGSANYIDVAGGAANTGPVISTQGINTNINLLINPKGTGNVGIGTGAVQPSAPLEVRRDQNSTTEVSLYNAGTVTGGQVNVRYMLRNSTSGSPTGGGGYLGLRGNDLRLWNEFGNPIAVGVNGTQMFRFLSAASVVNNFTVIGSATTQPPILAVEGSDTNIDLSIVSKGTGGTNVSTGGGVQFRVGDTFGGGTATNYWVAQGRASAGPFLSVAGADTNINAIVGTKGTGAVQFSTNGGAQEQARIAHTASAVNYIQVTGAVTGGTPTVSAQGSDANVNLSLASKGSGIVYIGGTSNATTSTIRLSPSGGSAFFASATNASVNYIMATGAAAGSAPQLIARGTDTNIGVRIGTLNAGNIDLLASGDPNAGTGALQMRVSPTVSAVNYIQVTGAATGGEPTISAQGSDTNLDINLTPKGTGYANITSGGVKFPDGTTQTTAAAGLTAAGNASIAIFNTNITANATIATGTNGLSVGPVNTANGVVVTIGANATWITL